MNFLTFEVMIIFCLIFECSCRSVHVHEEVRSQFKANDENLVNHKHENKDTFSWIKLKPILRQEMKHSSKDKDSASIQSFTEDADESHSSNKEISRSPPSLVESDKDFVEIVFQSKANTNEIDVTNNVTLMPHIESILAEENSPNGADSETLKFDENLPKKEFPYNITPDILAESGDLIVFLAVSDNQNEIGRNVSNDTSLLNEGMSVALEEISTTGYELLRAFELQQNSIEPNLTNFQNVNKSSNFQIDLDMGVLKMPDDWESENQEYSEKITITEAGEMLTGTSEMVKTEIALDKSPNDKNPSIKLNENFADIKTKENISFDLPLIELNMSDPGDNITNDDESRTQQIDLSHFRIESENIKQDVTHSLEDAKVTNFSKAEQSNSKCPDPGVCIFWFLAFDSCDEDSHCFGSLICCMWGCSKMCMDVNSEIP